MRPQTDSIQLRSDCNPPVLQSHVAKTRIGQVTVLNESSENCKQVQVTHVDGQPESLCCPRSLLLSDSGKRGDVVPTSCGAHCAVISTRERPRLTTSQELQQQGALGVKGGPLSLAVADSVQPEEC